MKFLYNLTVFLISLVLPIIALFNKKLQLFIDGRKQTFLKIQALKNEETVWFHVASLGEFEQARPIIEELKSSFTKYKILVTFFSPSGYEVRKNYDLADVVCYLPLDSVSNAEKFVKNINIKMAIFVKYEFWPNFLNELSKNQIPTILVSGIFREQQLFFQFYGGFMRNSLKAFHHFFLQDENSKKLLKSIDFKNSSVVGDTRFDRVSRILNQDNSIDFINEFKNNTYTLVAGSTWREDEELLVNYINNSTSKDEKFIIAPHNINKEAIATLRKSILTKTVLFSEKEGKNLADFDVIIIDTIGILTKIYASVDVAYVGGGLKTGLHNILEPATFGIPVVIGNKFDKFKEAVDLVNLKGCITIRNQNEFSSIFTKLKKEEDFRKSTGNINKKYIQEHLGASQKIINYLKKQF
ncbi:MAG: 3-deoxy-D-manno-octulosonic acid transferase [Flavobacteriia bacterium]|nr:3-deoxy-D-manno-octulosonic acid transferase [Flavobacteriia bacterium]OIP46454.1 MAG: 3-deoxy-D-manno-octulosonic acid transferase [Flavobacteriaceae bacterium CG2_30_31_66]PIV96564.1 MAG: 3-deoxy-D-manno-octulosonic acid transferase [Flavobacteriaceae bacterium CG17_big_fil_post_rev_8_21_14_2_50_31_13]PIX10958.1 MAG: 3-deoxy-D-manno-octulosonic acid transferase [Flavobacteriaceae bacterium CG_4_8_14_3_um_filter_31_8]PIY16086.1 MAG: 3-deoxy-D-manno-octulosonic acid transferase [Flavobacteri